jgi:hypothetical protein
MRMSRLTGLLFLVALMLAAPAQALGAQSLAVTSPTGFPAGGDPTYTTKIALDSSAGTPQNVTIKLAPGVLAAPSANPSCVKKTQHTSSCQIGSGTVTIMGLPAPVNAYLAPPPSSSDVVGIDVVPISGALPGLPVTHGAGKLVQTPAGDVQTVLSLSLKSLGPLAMGLSAMTLTVDGKLDGKPFNRMPTNCSPGKTQLTVAYSKKTETVNASPDFKPTGCSSLPYSPQVSGTAQASTTGAGTVVTSVTQPLGQAASAKTTLTLPTSSVSPNVSSIKLQNKPTPVGTAVTVSPLLPAPLRGKIYLKGSLAKPFLLFKFPPPAALTLTGQVNLDTNAVTIQVVPDVPLTRLTVTFPGGPDGLLLISCNKHPGNLVGKFTAQSGKTATASHPLTVTGCKG